jgi:hypothetical protein
MALRGKMKADFKQFAKFLILAQSASDAGKGYVPEDGLAHNAQNAVQNGYDLKDRYIFQAIAYAKRLPNGVVNIGVDYDMGMSIIYFDVPGYGQVSFHSYSKFGVKSDPNVAWNGVRGGSLATCEKLARKLGLLSYYPDNETLKHIKRPRRRRRT